MNERKSLCGEHALECECEKFEEGTCELVIYCYECKTHWQLNPEMIALSLATCANIWDVYNYILTTKCSNCKK